MKPSPTKNNTAKLSTNQRIGTWQEVKYNERQKALEVAEKEQRTHELATKIVKLLIESGLSVNDQLKVINDVREKLLFCKKTGQEMKQLTLF